MAAITIKPTLKQHKVYEALKDPDVDAVFFGGGAGGGKSWLICESRLINCYLYPGYRSYIGREELKRLMQSTYVTWTKVCKHHGIPEGDWKINGQYNYIEFKNGSRIDLLDLKFLPSDPLYERFGSLEYSDGAIEEAGEVNFLAYDVLKSRTGRHMNDVIKPCTLITGNPKKNWTYREFYRKWKDNTLPKNIVFIQSLCEDNPYTAESYKKQLMQIQDNSTKQRLMYGNWEYDDDPAVMIKFDDIVDMFSNPIADSNDKYLIVDVARFGRDKTAMSLWKGMKLVKWYIKYNQGVDKTIDDIKDITFKEQIPRSHVLIDEDGIGGGVVDGLSGVKGFIANSSPEDGNFANLKTQCAYKLADKAAEHEIGIEMEDGTLKEELIEEIEQLKTKDSDKDQKRKIIPKDEIKENIGRSPDLLDNLIMRMYFEIKDITSLPQVIQSNITYNRR